MAAPERSGRVRDGKRYTWRTVGSEIHRPVREKSQTLEAATAALRHSEQMLAAERESVERLQQVATKLISAQGIEALYDEILDTLQATMRAPIASIQMFYPERGTNGELRLLGHRGFSEHAAKRWEWVSATTHTTCGEALRTGRKVAVPDISRCGFMAGTEDLEGYLDAGIRAGHTLPLVSRSGALLGMVSTYWREPHEFTASELRVLDVLARLAADLIERSRTERKVRESEERFRRVFEEGPLGLGIVGMNYRFEKVNSALCQMVGYSEAELLEKSFVDITHPDDVRADVELAERLFRREISFYQLPKRYVKKNGEVIWINLTASLLRDQEGEPLYGLAMIEDITELKRSQEEALARQKLESLGVLAGGIAHDFNNLLGGILSQTESIEQDLPDGSPQIEGLRRIKDAAIRGSEIVRELMIYSGKDKADLESVDVARLVEEMLGLLTVSVSKHATLKSDLPKDLPAVPGNASQLRQLVMNLVINASEAIGETDGAIRVTLSRVAPGQDLASNDAANRRQSDYLRLEVSDTGSGITEENQARIFDPFFTTKFAGRGLGLAVVQRIVSSHGGAINVVSTPNQGTTFQIDLPCTGAPSNPDGSVAVATADGRISGAAGTVLLVEDEDMLRDTLAKMLRKHGFSVIEAANGSAALDLVRRYRNSVEVILLDLTIPGAPSGEVVAEAQRIRPGVIVVLMSAYSRGMVPPALNVPEVKDFIRKPFQMGDLVQLLRDTISAKRS